MDKLIHPFKTKMILQWSWADDENALVESMEGEEDELVECGGGGRG